MSLNRNIKSIDLIKKIGFKKTIDYVFPIKFNSNHAPSKSRSNSLLFIFIGTAYLIAQLASNFFSINRFEIKSNYHLLIFVPNIKYKKFAEALIKDVNFSHLIISDEIYISNVLSVNDFKILKSKNYVFDLLEILFHLFKFAFKTNQINDFKNFYWDILSLIRRDLLVFYLFKNVSFNKYFSLHPVDGFHQIIQNFYSEKFKSTYAIRPTTTVMAKEHSYISTDNLFYKTIDEFQIYKNLNLHSNLLQGGLISENGIIIGSSQGDVILFLDTCTNINNNSVYLRRKAVLEFLSYANVSNFNVYFKFHPGLIYKEVKYTKKLISSFKNPRLKVLNTDILWDEICLAIGFDTTVFYDCILNQVPVLSLRDEYCLISEPNNIEFLHSPIVSINKKSDFKLISNLIYDRKLLKNLIFKQYNWLVKKYNYPNGLKCIKTILG